MIRHLMVTDSSNVASVGYDITTRTLEVCYRRGGTYSYANVVPVQFCEMLGAASMGVWLASHMRANPEHPHTKVETPSFTEG